MKDSREKGRPLEYGPLAESVLTGFRITLTEPMKDEWTVRFQIDDFDMYRILSVIDYRRIFCPFCDTMHIDEEHHCQMWLEEHIHMRHGHELPPSHPLHRPTRMMRLIDWLERGGDTIDL